MAEQAGSVQCFIVVDVEEIPGKEIDWKEWLKWCSEHNLLFIDNEKRAYSSFIDEDINDRRYAMIYRGNAVGFLTEEEYADLKMTSAWAHTGIVRGAMQTGRLKFDTPEPGNWKSTNSSVNAIQL